MEHANSLSQSEGEKSPTRPAWPIVAVVASLVALVGALVWLDFYGPGTQYAFLRRLHTVLREGMTFDQCVDAIRDSGDLRLEKNLEETDMGNPYPRFARWFTVMSSHELRVPILERVRRYIRFGHSGITVKSGSDVATVFVDDSDRVKQINLSY